MSMRKIFAILKKQCKDTLKNKAVLIQFVMFPAITLIMQNAISIDGMPTNYFVMLFATMYVGMAPLTAMATVISEEKEKNTLRILMMSNIKSVEYLLGIGGYVFLICMLGSVVFAVAGGYSGVEFAKFLAIMAAGIITSLLMGAAIGVWSKNEMAATSITVPVMLVFAFLPMLSMFNEKIATVSRFTYSQQVQDVIYGIGNSPVTAESAIVIGLNIICAVVLFSIAYKKCGLA